MKTDSIELLNSEGPILVAKHVTVSHEGEKGVLLEFLQDDEFYIGTVEDLKKFLSGEMKISVKGEEVDYTTYPESMKPSSEKLQSFLNQSNGNNS